MEFNHLAIINSVLYATYRTRLSNVTMSFIINAQVGFV